MRVIIIDLLNQQTQGLKRSQSEKIYSDIYTQQNNKLRYTHKSTFNQLQVEITSIHCDANLLWLEINISTLEHISPNEV